MNTYLYLNVADLLHDKFKAKKRVNPAFSIRAWANQLGLKSHGPLQQILAGKRSLPKKYIPVITKSLGLDVGESLYFETLVDFDRAKTQEEKELYFARLKHLRPNKRDVKILEIENFKFFENPLHSIFRTLMERADFKFDPVWVQSVLNFKVSLIEIEEVINRLKDLDLLEVKSGKAIKKYRSVHNKIDVPNKAVEVFHEKMCKLAAVQVSKQDLQTREYNSFSFNINKEKLVQAKIRLREFSQEFIEEFEDDSFSSTDTYQLNLQLFSLTKKEKK